MDTLNFFGSVASVIGLGVSIYTLYKVENLRGVLWQRSREGLLSQLIVEVSQILPSKKGCLRVTCAGD